MKVESTSFLYRQPSSSANNIKAIIMMHRHRLTSAVFLITLFTVSGFSSNPRSIHKQSIVSPFVLLATEEVEVAVTTTDSASQTTTDEAPKAAVRCPDCDMCDGSGR